MSYSTIEQVLVRIRYAAANSPIAVFSAKELGKLNAVFASTVETQRLINSSDPEYIGTYHGGMDLKGVKSELRRSGT